MLIDCHTHAFADKIADKAVAQLIQYYKIPTRNGGRLRDLLNAANQARLDALVLLVAATRPEQVKPANDWILKLARTSSSQLQKELDLTTLPRIIPFGTFHPEDPEWLPEIQRLRAAGIRGIKLHPEFQRIDLADPALEEFCEEIGEDFVLMVHIGDPKVSPDNFSTPRKIGRLLDRFPKLHLIAAHLGGYCFWDEVLEQLAGRQLYFDTSSTFPYIRPELLQQIVQKHGAEQILFGSDYPLSAPGDDLSYLDRLVWLSATQKELILGKNCAQIFNG